MRRIVVAAMSLTWSATAFGQELQPDGAALLETLARTEAYGCTIGGEFDVIVLRELNNGGLEVVGAEPGHEVMREDGRTVVLQGSNYLQIAGANSVSVYEGEVMQGNCTDLSQGMYKAVILALGNESGEALVSMRSDLLSRLGAVSDEAASLREQLEEVRAERDRLSQEIGGTAADLEAARAQLEVANSIPECLEKVHGPLTIALSFLEEGAGSELSPGARESYARANADRVRSVIEACPINFAGESVNPSPTMTPAEWDAFRVSVQQCWLVDPGSQAGRVTVTVEFELGRDAKVAGQVRLIDHNAESDSAANSAYESARRAILRCQTQGGFPLPEDKYEQWRLVQMTFDSEQMVIQ